MDKTSVRFGAESLKTDRTPQNTCFAEYEKEYRERPKPVKYLNTEENTLFDQERRALNVCLKKRGTLAGPLFPCRRHHGISRWALDELMKKYHRIAVLPNTTPEQTTTLEIILARKDPRTRMQECFLMCYE